MYNKQTNYFHMKFGMKLLRPNHPSIFVFCYLFIIIGQSACLRLFKNNNNKNQNKKKKQNVWLHFHNLWLLWEYIFHRSSICKHNTRIAICQSNLSTPNESNHWVYSIQYNTYTHIYSDNKNIHTRIHTITHHYKVVA